jgi:hypothetical protein
MRASSFNAVAPDKHVNLSIGAARQKKQRWCARVAARAAFISAPPHLNATRTSLNPGPDRSGTADYDDIDLRPQ